MTYDPTRLPGIIAVLKTAWEKHEAITGERFISVDDVAAAPESDKNLIVYSARDLDIAFAVVAQASGYVHVLTVAGGDAWGLPRAFSSLVPPEVEPEHPVLIEWVWSSGRDVRLYCRTEDDAVLLRLALGDRDA